MSGIKSLRMKQNGREHIAAISAGQKAAAARKAAGEGFIYVAAIGDTDAIKIGFSLFPERRISQLGSGVRMLGYFQASIRAERALHVMLRGHRHPDFDGQEVYPRSILTHNPIPEELRSAA